MQKFDIRLMPYRSPTGSFGDDGWCNESWKKIAIVFAILNVPTWQEAFIEGSNRPREEVLLENSALIKRWLNAGRALHCVEFCDFPPQKNKNIKN
jgi:hypothetical protein